MTSSKKDLRALVINTVLSRWYTAGLHKRYKKHTIAIMRHQNLDKYKVKHMQIDKNSVWISGGINITGIMFSKKNTN